MNQAQTVVDRLQNKSKDVIQQSKSKPTEAFTRTGKLLEQAKQVVSGTRIIANRIDSFF